MLLFLLPAMGPDSWTSDHGRGTVCVEEAPFGMKVCVLYRLLGGGRKKARRVADMFVSRLSYSSNFLPIYLPSRERSHIPFKGSFWKMMIFLFHRWDMWSFPGGYLISMSSPCRLLEVLWNPSTILMALLWSTWLSVELSKVARTEDSTNLLKHQRQERKNLS